MILDANNGYHFAEDSLHTHVLKAKEKKIIQTFDMGIPYSLKINYIHSVIRLLDDEVRSRDPVAP